MRTEKIQGCDGESDGHPFRGNQWGEGSGGGGSEGNGKPPVENGRITLTHYSNKPGLTVLQPYNYGSGLAGREAGRKVADKKNWIDRTYHGIAVGKPGGYIKEPGLGRYKYTSSVPAKDIYDFTGDPDKLYKKADDWFENSTSMYEKAIKQHGYTGYWVNHPSLGLVAATFNEIEPSKEEVDTPKTLGSDALAMDKGSVRTLDAFGRLHTSLVNISKANICPYYGREIPDYKELGLDADKVYRLYRDPKELEKGAATSNGVQLLSKHIPVSPNEPQKEVVAGCTGNDAVFKAPYLMNTLTVWDAEDITGIESGDKKELSCGYSYKPVMQNGTVNGEAYDGVMTNIVFNHVAIVEQGRAGPDVVVGDSQFVLSNPELKMAQVKKAGLSRKAVLAKGALAAVILPKLATDAKIDFMPILTGVTHQNWQTKKAAIIADIFKATKGKLRKSLVIGDIRMALDGLDDEPEGGPDDNVATDNQTSGAAAGTESVSTGDPGDPNGGEPAQQAEDPLGKDADGSQLLDQIRTLLTGKISDDDMLQLEAMLGGAGDAPAADPNALQANPAGSGSADPAAAKPIVPPPAAAGAAPAPAAKPPGASADPAAAKPAPAAASADPAAAKPPAPASADPAAVKPVPDAAGAAPQDDGSEAALLAKLKSLIDQLSGGAPAPASEAPPAAAKSPDAGMSADPAKKSPDPTGGADAPNPPFTEGTPQPPNRQPDGSTAAAVKGGGNTAAPVTSTQGNTMNPTKEAMDAAISVAVKKAELSTMQRMRDIAEAERIVRPYIGELTMAQDSAEAVYKMALEAHGVDVKSIHPSAFKTMVSMLTKPGETQPHSKVRMAQDGATVTTLAARFPNAGRIHNLG